MSLKPIDTSYISQAIFPKEQRLDKAAGFKWPFALQSSQPQTSTTMLLSKQWNTVSDYFLDLWSIMDSGLALAQHYAQTVPQAVRTAVAAFGALNVLMVPKMTKYVLMSLWALFVTLPSQGLTSVAEGLVRVPFLVGLTAAYGSVGALGLQELLKNYGLPAKMIAMIPPYIFPWVGYALRLSSITQLADITSGVAANEKLNQLLKPASRLDIFKPVGMQSLEILEQHKRLFRKVADTDFDKTIDRIRVRAHSWILPVSWYGCWQAKNMAKNLHKRSITHVENQTLGLAANMCAVMAMVAGSYLVATSIFAILRSIYFILQTHHRQTQINI